MSSAQLGSGRLDSACLSLSQLRSARLGSVLFYMCQFGLVQFDRFSSVWSVQFVSVWYDSIQFSLVWFGYALLHSATLNLAQLGSVCLGLSRLVWFGSIRFG